MRVCLIVLGLLVLIVCIGNEVNGSPVPDPCIPFFKHGYWPPITATTTTTTTGTPPPKTEDKPQDTRKEQIKQYKSILEEILFGEKEVKKVEIQEPAPAQAKTYDMNAFFAAYVEFLTKFFNMFSF